MTEANLYDPLVRLGVASFMEELEATVRRFHEMDFPSNVDIVMEVELSSEGDIENRSYYMVDLSRRCLFWMHDFDANYMATMIGGVGCKQHLRT